MFFFTYHINHWQKQGVALLLLLMVAKPFFGQSIDSSQSLTTDSVAKVEKRLYDTSKYFFNWKEYFDDPYAIKPIETFVHVGAEITRFKKMDDFWYIDSIEKFRIRQVRLQMINDSLARLDSSKLREKEEDKQLLPLSFNESPWFSDTMIWIIRCMILGCFIFGILYFLNTNKISIWNKSRGSIVESDTISEITTDIFQLPYDSMLSDALANKNYRLHIRLQYLQIITLLTQRGLIQYQPDNTNYRYLMQLRKSRHYNAFLSVTRHYEYVWYGKFEVNVAAFESIQKEIHSLKEKLMY